MVELIGWSLIDPSANLLFRFVEKGLQGLPVIARFASPSRGRLGLSNKLSRLSYIPESMRVPLLLAAMMDL